MDGGQILNEQVPLCARKLGLFRDGETVRETGEDVELLWKIELFWTGTDVESLEPLIQNSGRISGAEEINNAGQGGEI